MEGSRPRDPWFSKLDTDPIPASGEMNDAERFAAREDARPPRRGQWCPFLRVDVWVF